ncbi:MAG TPA: DNA repair helicase XPB [Actinomycetes bacterium]|jgi:DNA excision repair protein ERCC-3|nr:DNA repair helicase XPB [Actinomycetes bacterium]
MADGALIVQSDRSVLLEVDHPKADAARAAIAPFAELEKSPEHVHTYRLTPLALWNARAAGLTPAQVTEALREHSRYPVPPGLLTDLVETMGRYGRLVLRAGEDGLELVSSDPAVLTEVVRSRKVAPHLGGRLGPDRVAVPLAERGRLKQALLALGWPADDQAGYVEGAPLPIELLPAHAATGEPFGLRRYQRESVAAFAAAGSGVIVLPCGAGKTLVGLGAMAAVGARTLILVTSTLAARQWREELLARTDLQPAQVGEYSGARKEVAPVTIATYQVLITRRGGRHTHLDLLGREDWGLIVYDEVHLLPAPVFRMTAEIQARRRLGLTATLVREDGREADVFSLIGPKRYDVPWRDLEAQGWVAAADCVEVRVDLTDEERMDYALAEPEERYRRAATARSKLPVVASLAEAHRADRVLVIGQYLDQLRTLGELLEAPVITGDTPVSEREVLFAAFRSGELGRLVVSKVANFSIDLPEANVAIQVSGTFGSRQEEAQRLGRILRPKADGGRARFYTVVSRDTNDTEYAQRRQRFLAEQGYAYQLVDATEVLATRA